MKKNSAFESLTANTFLTLNKETIEQVWQFYKMSFDPIKKLAAARHMLTREELLEELTDTRILKILALDERGRAHGILTATTDFSALSWIEPGFYSHSYPEETEKGRLFYLGFVAVDPGAQGSGAYKIMMKVLGDMVCEVEGFVAFDVCKFNGATAQIVRSVLNGLTPGYDQDLKTIDTQTYHVLGFKRSA